jgi:branched-chain amino acid transport system ATP-binding protein
MHAMEVVNLSKQFGALEVTRNVSLSFGKGERTALIGPNGAGKTTLVNLITGAIPASSGEILLGGNVITGLPEFERARRGLVRTFQITKLIRPLTAEDNIRIAVQHCLGLQTKATNSSRHHDDVDGRVARILSEVQLEDRAKVVVSRLAYGEQRLVELALALALEPKVLLLDEPAAGVPQSEAHIIMKAIEALPNDLAVIFIEHDMDLVFRFAKRIVVLVNGAVLADGDPAAIAANEEVKQIYFGEEVSS